MRRAGIVLAAVAGVVATAGVPAATRAEPRVVELGVHRCAAGYRHAIIAGRHRCLRRGQRCDRRYDRQYHRYGFHCHAGRLTPRRSPPPPTANLSLAKVDEPDPVVVGNRLTYTLTIRNAGPARAVGVEVRDMVPPGVVFVSATTSQGSCSGTAVVSCLLGSLAAGASATITIAVTPTVVVETLPNSASVAARTRDPAPGNDAASTSTTVIAAAG